MILASFADQAAMLAAAAKLREAGLDAETYAAMPGEAHASPLPIIMLLAGLLGAGGAFAMQAYATTVSYPLNIGGRPNFFWLSYIPYTFETGVLFAMLAGFLGYFALNRMPHLYHPIDESDAFRAATTDGWFVAITGPTAGAPALLDTLHPLRVEVLAT